MVGLDPRHLKHVRDDANPWTRFDGSQITNDGLTALRGHNLKWLLVDDTSLRYLAGFRHLNFVSIVDTAVTATGLEHANLQNVSTVLMERDPAEREEPNPDAYR